MMIRMKKAGVFICAVLMLGQCTKAQDIKTMVAQMGNVKLNFNLDNVGQPTYSVSYKDKLIIVPSTLGFALKDDSSFYKSFVLLSAEKKQADDTWQPVWGEVKNIRNHYEQLTVHLRQKDANRLLDIVFRVFEDGVGFRYEFPKQKDLVYFVISNEFTQFNLTGD